MTHTTTGVTSKTMVVQGQVLSTANLSTIEVESLAAKDPLAVSTLLHAAQTTGFFYLTPKERDLEFLSRCLKTLYSDCEEYFSQTHEQKMDGFQKDVDRGYKHGPGHESFEIARDEEATVQLPKSFSDHSDMIWTFTNMCDRIVRTCLLALSDGLGLEGPARLENKHRPDRLSDTGLKFISGPTGADIASLPNTTHTDGGSLTLLWCEKWASQFEIPGTNEWRWIEPKDGHILVNIADSLQEMTGGQLKSPVHRVTQPANGVEERYFVSYYLRPAKVN